MHDATNILKIQFSTALYYTLRHRMEYYYGSRTFNRKGEDILGVYVQNSKLSPLRLQLKWSLEDTLYLCLFSEQILWAAALWLGMKQSIHAILASLFR